MITNDYKWLITCGGAPDFKSGRISWIFRIRHSAGFYYKSGRILNKKDVKLFQVLFYVSQNTAESSPPPGSSPRIQPPPAESSPPGSSSERIHFVLQDEVLTTYFVTFRCAQYTIQMHFITNSNDFNFLSIITLNKNIYKRQLPLIIMSIQTTI